MTIADNKVATFHYTLKDEKGKLIESSAGQDPLSYLHGNGGIIEGLEEALTGKKAGDKFDITITPDKAYGTRNDDLVEIVSKAEFDAGEEISVGKEFQYEDEDGTIHQVYITKIEGDDVTVDENHPMADKTLNFSIEVVGVREATEEELDHGHVHDAEGHHDEH